MRRVLGAITVLAALAFMQSGAKAQTQPAYHVDGDSTTSTPRTQTLYTNSGSTDKTVTVNRAADGQSGDMYVNDPDDSSDPVYVEAGGSYVITIPPGHEVKVTMQSSGGNGSGTFSVN